MVSSPVEHVGTPAQPRPDRGRARRHPWPEVQRALRRRPASRRESRAQAGLGPRQVSRHPVVSGEATNPDWAMLARVGEVRVVGGGDAGISPTRSTRSMRSSGRRARMSSRARASRWGAPRSEREGGHPRHGRVRRERLKLGDGLFLCLSQMFTRNIWSQLLQTAAKSGGDSQGKGGSGSRTCHTARAWFSHLDDDGFLCRGTKRMLRSRPEATTAQEVGRRVKEEEELVRIGAWSRTPHSPSLMWIAGAACLSDEACLLREGETPSSTAIFLTQLSVPCL